MGRKLNLDLGGPKGVREILVRSDSFFEILLLVIKYYYLSIFVELGGKLLIKTPIWTPEVYRGYPKYWSIHTHFLRCCYSS